MLSNPDHFKITKTSTTWRRLLVIQKILLKSAASPRKHVKGAAASRKAEGAFKGLKGARFTEILH